MQAGQLPGVTVAGLVAPGDRAQADGLSPSEAAWLALLSAAGWPPHCPAVVALEAAEHRMGGAAGHAAHAVPADLPALSPATRAGGPAIVAVIDDAVGFLHRRFRRADGRSRFDAVWLMAPPVTPAGPRGRVLLRADIDALAARGCEASAYAAVMADLFPPDAPRGLTRAVTHGTHVADLAAGATPGAMDGIDLLAACLPPRALRDTTGDSWAGDLVLALHWVVQRAVALSAACKAGPRPLVLNLSLGMSAGPKDGTGLAERAIVEALAVYEATAGAPARATLPFGNDYRARQVAHVTPRPDVPAGVGWQIPPDDRQGARLLVRAAGPVALALDPPGPQAPAGRAAPVDLAPGAMAEVRHRGRVVAVLHAQPGGPGPVRSYDITVLPTRGDGPGPVAPSGRWHLGIHCTDGAPDPVVSLQVQRGDTPPGQRSHGRQSRLVHPECNRFDPVMRDWSDPGSGPITRWGTHSALVAPHDRRVLAVAAAGSRPVAPGRLPAPARYSAAGSSDASRAVRPGPDACAPAEASPNRPGVVAAGTRSGTAVRLSGTSVAAPALARVLARELGPGGVLAGGRHPDEIGALLALPGGIADVSDPARLGRGWLPSGGARRS
ncbi:MAG: hypothetical protein MUF73_07700 [Rhodobacteraceae bacterium]|nr:hypothetical protein [Paracoccaceae bacterium]